MDVPFFAYSEVFQKNKQQILIDIEKIIDTGRFILQSQVSDVEDALKAQCGGLEAVTVGNATDGLEMLIEAMELPKGGEVIVSLHTMSATVSAIKRNGLIPVCTAISSDLMLTLDSVRAAYSENTVAVCLTQLNGFVAPDSQPIADFCHQNGIVLFEDLAQSMTAAYDGKQAGHFGLGGAISFYPAKVFGCMGDGGAVISKDRSITGKIRAIRDHGRAEGFDPKYLCGRNSRMDTLQCAVLLNTLKDYDPIIKARRSIFKKYSTAFRGINEICIPSVYHSSSSYGICQNYEIAVEDREALRTHLTRAGVGTLVQWGGVSTADYTYVVDRANDSSKELFSKLIILPCYPTMNDTQVEKVINEVKGFYAS